MMMKRKWIKTSFVATIFAVSLLVGAASAFANPIINENAKGPGGYSITPGSHTYSLSLIASHNYTIYVQPTGSTTYNYHFTLS